MRVVKPARLSLLTRPYRWQGVDMLGTAVLAMSTLDAQPVLLTEQALWKLAAEEAGGLLDLGIPKPCPEFLVSGQAYTTHQADKTACAVRAHVGGLEKSLLVFGERYWLDGHATAPAPFDAMRVDWRHAYGGPQCAENPLGLGCSPRRVSGMDVVPLPNVESPRQRVSRPGSITPPAGFDAIPPDWPQRMARMGSAYGQAWLEQSFPGFPADMDFRFFNAAPEDQWWIERQEVPARAAYEIHNMHPHRAVQQGHLPDWRARCFARRRAGDALEEIDLRLTTVWFFPHRDCVAMIWHGALPIQEDDAADIAHVMPALELSEEHRDTSHYDDVLRRRVHTRDGALHALRESDLVAPALYERAPDAALPDVMERPAARNMLAGAARRRETHRATLAAEGLDPDLYLPALQADEAPPPVHDLAARLEWLERERAQGEALLSRGRAELLADADMRAFAARADIDLEAVAHARPDAAAGGFDVRTLRRQLRDYDAHASMMATPADGPTGDPATPARPGLHDRFGASLDRMYLLSAHTNERPPGLTPHRAQRTRRRVAARYQHDRDFSGARLVGADLSGMDLRGSCFRGASLEGARLDGACLDDCDFTQAVLARASMKGGSLARARLAQASLGQARFEGVAMTGAALQETQLEGAHFLACSFAGAALRRTRMSDSRFEGCDFQATSWAEVLAVRATLQDSRFEDAVFDGCGWMECTFAALALPRARLTRCAFINTRCAGMDFSHARLEASSFSTGTALQAVVFEGAELRHCGMRGVKLDRGRFAHARLYGCDFSECTFVQACLDHIEAAESLFTRADFDGASLRRANLIDAILTKAHFTRADLSEANLFRADLGQALLNDTTAMRGAYTTGAKVWPRRRAPAPDSTQ
jgi:uncharacterized protein YjbI with pentapeptide repeats